jgi:hypothetical protein
MRLVQLFRSAFAPSPSPPVHDAETRRAVARRVVRRFSTGNIRLQRGEYLTREDVDKQLEKIKSLDLNEK